MARNEFRKATKRAEVLTALRSSANQPGVKMPPPPPDIREEMAEHIAELLEKVADLTERVIALENR